MPQNQVIRGIDIEVQPGNPGAVALYFFGAQGGTVQDVSVRLAPDALAGFGGGGGAGMSHMRVEVDGGQHGVYFQASQGAALLGSARLTNQSGAAIVFSGKQTFIVVGVNITRASSATGPAIQVLDNSSPADAQITVLDSVIRCGAPANTGNLSRPAVSATGSVYMREVWVSGGCGQVLVHQPHSRHAALRRPPDWGHTRTTWAVVRELARGVDTLAHNSGRTNFTAVRHRRPETPPHPRPTCPPPLRGSCPPWHPWAAWPAPMERARVAVPQRRQSYT